MTDTIQGEVRVVPLAYFNVAKEFFGDNNYTDPKKKVTIYTSDKSHKKHIVGIVKPYTDQEEPELLIEFKGSKYPLPMKLSKVYEKYPIIQVEDRNSAWRRGGKTRRTRGNKKANRKTSRRSRS